MMICASPVSSDPHWTAYLSALLTPTVAFFGIFIAFRQWRTAQNKLKLELFDRRLAVYEVALKFIAAITAHGKVKDDELFQFLSGVREAKWLLSVEIAEYLDKELYRNAVDLHCLEEELQEMPHSEQRKTNIHKQAEIKKWFVKQFDVLDEKFSLFLKLAH
ncbi:hypothetical protein [Methylocaldum gracile]|uniref:hypothetical protein n=1 Tax=Methylocaldum sp. 0917 TaxID=2485163 RepID=UPI00105B3920